MTSSSGAPEPSPYVRRLPVGERLPLPSDSFVGWPNFPFEGELTVRALTPPVLPEPPRTGEAGPEDCPVCRSPVTEAPWADEHWRVDPVGADSGIPAVVMVQPRSHHDLSDLPVERSAEMGPLLQRVERAVLALEGVARVHVSRWGDGLAHLHLWVMARPEGMTQLRGSFLPLWDELLPRVPEAERREAHRRIAAALATGGGTAYAT